MRIICILIVVLLASCSAQKRRYQKGFHVQWLKNERIGYANANHNTSVHPVRNREANLNAGHTAYAQQLTRSGSEIENFDCASARSKDLFVPQKKRRCLSADTCDAIYLRDGKKIQAKIIEIGTELVKYHKCDFPDGPVFSNYKGEIALIIYANGSHETFSITEAPVATAAPAPVPTQKYDDRAKVREDAGLAFTMGLLGLLFVFYGSIHAIVLGFRVLRVIRNNPGRYEGEGLATAGIVLGIIKLAAVFAFIFLTAFIF